MRGASLITPNNLPRRPATLAAIASLVAVAVPGAASAGRAQDGWSSCSASDLRIAVGPAVSEQTQQHTAVLGVTNSGRAPCLLRGYPHVALLDRAGKRLPFLYRSGGDQMLADGRPTPVRLAVGGTAYVALNKNVCVTRARAVARAIRVSVLGVAGTLSLELPRYPILDYCASGDPGHAVDVSPLARRLPDLLCHRRRSCG